jgi:hypothetical protein
MSAADLSAFVGARAFNLGDMLFKYLAVGGTFQFSNDPQAETFVRSRRGFVSASGGARTFRTGARTAV